MKNFVLLLIIPFFLQSQCADGEYEILFETYSGEWAEEITWSIIDNNGDLVAYYDESETENDTWYNQTACLSSGCYAFEANDSFGDGWNEAFVDISSVNSNVDFGVTDLSIELESGFISHTIFQINDFECIYSGLGCTDENANNYNEDAFISDDSCEYSCQEGEYILEIETTTGEKVKSVKYSVLLLKSAKALQEAIPVEIWQKSATRPLDLLDLKSSVTVIAKTHGGGISGQADALSLGISRALIEMDSNLRPKLKSKGLLTRDSRIKESKKYGLKRARKAQQFTKR